MQVLYEIDVQPELSAEAAVTRVYAHFVDEVATAGAPEEIEARAFAERLVAGVVEHRGIIDERISSASRNWRVERMGRVDRNVLRLAVYEMTLGRDVPPKVALNEAIEIAKRYGAQETPAFVNGVLDRVLADLGR